MSIRTATEIRPKSSGMTETAETEKTEKPKGFGRFGYFGSVDRHREAGGGEA